MIANYAVSQNSSGQLFVMTGMKVPLGKADAGGKGISLPMDYQSSLETYDLMLGSGFSRGPFELHIGWQQPLTDEISNTFISERYPDSLALKYGSTNRFTRKADALLRVSYNLKIAKGRLSLRPSVLPIFHIANDTYLDSLGAGQEISGSGGLTLNGNLFLTYRITRAHELEFSYGMPFVTRDVRPDGLTRNYVLAFDYHFFF